MPSHSPSGPAGRPRLLSLDYDGLPWRAGDISHGNRALDSGWEARHPDTVARGEHDRSKGHS
jgi:hypothetical protein